MKAWRSEAGFSLVEVMVVVAIIGLMASAVMLTLPDEADALDDTIDRTERAMTALARHATLSGQVLGVRFEARGFAVLQLSDTGWTPEANILKAEALSFGGPYLQMLQVDGKAIDFAAEGEGVHVWFLPTGDRPDFTLTLDNGAHRGTMTMCLCAKTSVVPHA